MPVQTGGAAGTLAAGTVLKTARRWPTGRPGLPRLTSPTGWPPPGPRCRSGALAHQPAGRDLARRRAGRGDRRGRQDRRRRPVPEPARSCRARGTARRGARRVLGHAAEAEPRAVRADPQRRPAGTRPWPPSCTWPPPISTTNAPTAPGTANGRPCASCSAWPSAPPCSSRTGRGPAGLPRSHAPQPGPRRAAAAQRSRHAAVAPLLAGRPPGRPAGRTGKQRLQAVVDQTLRAPAAEQAATYRRLLRAAVPAELLSDARLEELLDPANYLGQAAEISRRILAAYPEYSAGGPARTGAGMPRHHRLPTERSLPWLDQQSKQYCCRPSARSATSPSSWWARPWEHPPCCGPRPAPCSGDDVDVVAWDLPGPRHLAGRDGDLHVAELADAVDRAGRFDRPRRAVPLRRGVPRRRHRAAAGHQARRTAQEPVRAVHRREARHAGGLAGTRRNRAHAREPR